MQKCFSIYIQPSELSNWEQCYTTEWTLTKILYFSNAYFNVRNRDIPCYKTRRSNGLILEKVNLECTKHAFFYKGATIFNYSF